MVFDVISGTGSLSPIQGSLVDFVRNPAAYGSSCVETSEHGCLYDAGVIKTGGWRVGHLALTSALGGYGMVTFDRLQTPDGSVPTIDCYLDQPLAAAQAYKRSEESDPALWLIEQHELDEAKQRFSELKKSVLLASPLSLTARIFQAGGVLIKVIEDIAADYSLTEEAFLWAWSSAPLLIQSDDAKKEAVLQAQANDSAAISSLWLRCTDEVAMSICNAWTGPGELRLHNVSSGNTFAAGSINEELLGKIFVGAI